MLVESLSVKGINKLGTWHASSLFVFFSQLFFQNLTKVSHIRFLLAPSKAGIVSYMESAPANFQVDLSGPETSEDEEDTGNRLDLTKSIMIKSTVDIPNSSTERLEQEEDSTNEVDEGDEGEEGDEGFADLTESRLREGSAFLTGESH